jgi:hypothetical protein
VGVTEESEIAWAAGLFEGEGTITCGRLPHNLRMAVMMTDRDVVEHFAEVLGGAARYWMPPRHRTHGWKAQWWWNASGQAAADILRLLLPYLGERRSARALELLEIFDEHVAEVTVERECPSCEQPFRPTYSAGSRAKVYCSKVCRNQARYRTPAVA